MIGFFAFPYGIDDVFDMSLGRHISAPGIAGFDSRRDFSMVRLDSLDITGFLTKLEKVFYDAVGEKVIKLLH